MAQFPKSYVNDVPKGPDRKLMETVPFDTMGIGARPSGLPKGGVNGAGLNIDHVGGSAQGKK